MKTCLCFILVTEEEFLTLAENLRPWTERAMKIEVAPWIRDYVVDMQHLYCELILEKLEYMPFGKEMTIIDSYKDLIIESAQVPNKILAKGDPGIGKTTLAKKIAWDWAKRHFSKVSIVLLVFLKSVHPNDSLEKVLLQQIPELAGLGITQDKIESVLEQFGRRCLLIFDGLDEHALGSNEDVLKVIKHEKYLNSNILVTSRPHSIAKIQSHCDTVVSVEGFTRSEATKFASHIVLDEKLVGQILDFNPAGSKQKVALHKCPILLSFMCILVREKAVDLTNKTMPTGEIYTRMIQCLYKKFTIRRKIQYDGVEFTKVVGLVGKLAWETLLSGDSLFQRSKVEKEVGKDVFDYGFLIGHQDMIGDLKADIFITFAHRSIQEFFGAFFFVLQLIEGNEINTLLNNAHKEPILMMNPLFLHFCFWFLSDKCNPEYFMLGNKENACKMLHSYIYERIYCNQVNISEIARTYPAIDIASAVDTRDEINMGHFSRIFDMFEEIILIAGALHPIEGILVHICRNVTLVAINDNPYVSQHYIPELTRPDPNFFNLVLSENAIVLKNVFECSVQLKRQPVVYLFLTNDRRDIDLSTLLHEKMHKLHVISTSEVTSDVVAKNDLVASSFLTHLSIIGNVYVHQSVMLSISEAVRGGRLPNLKSLSFAQANITHQLKYLFEETTTFPNVTHLNFSGCELDTDDIEALSYSLHNSLIPQLTSLALTYNEKGEETLFAKNCVPLTSLSVTGLTTSGFDDIVNSVAGGVSKSLKKLRLSTRLNTYCNLEKIDPGAYPLIEDLCLASCVWWFTSSNAQRFSNLVTEWRLHTLDVSHNHDIHLTFSVLMSHHFTSLKALILHDCWLDERDLNTLVRADREGRLPNLEHLDLSGNSGLFRCIGKLSSKWSNLKRLRIDRSMFAQHRSMFAQTSDVPAIDNLERFDVVTLALEDFDGVTDAIKSGHFPALRTVCLLSYGFKGQTFYTIEKSWQIDRVVCRYDYDLEKLLTDAGLT